MHFGLLKKGEEGYFLREETKVIPYVTRNEGLIFGAIIEPTDDVEYQFYSVLYAPSLPKRLSGDISTSHTNYSDGYRSPTYSYSGIGAHTMWLDEGDPVGIYKVEFYINSQLVKTIAFEVKKNLDTANAGRPH